MTTYKCLLCGKTFTAPVKVEYVRCQRYGGCADGVGAKTKKVKVKK